MTSRKAKITTTCKWTHNDTCTCVCWILNQHKTLMTLPLKSTWKVWHLYKTNISFSIKSIRQFSCSLYSLLNEEFRPNLNWPLFMFLLQTIEISSVLVNKLFKVTCYSKLESVESQVQKIIYNTLWQIFDRYV